MTVTATVVQEHNLASLIWIGCSDAIDYSLYDMTCPRQHPVIRIDA
jgi:hypothetical protein